LKALVLGFGSIGRRHASNLVLECDCDVSVFDVKSVDVSELPDELASRVNILDDLNSIGSGDFDFAVIATPNSCHLDNMKTMASNNINMFIEKPIASALVGLENIIEDIEEKNLLTMVACNMRFHPAAQRVKELIDSGSLGRIMVLSSEYGYYLPYQRPSVDYKTIYAASDDEGGIILDTIHEINLQRWFAGEVNSFECLGFKIGDLEISGYNYASANMLFEAGSIGEIHVDYLQKCKRRIYKIVFEGGTITWESVGKKPEICEVKVYRDVSACWESVFYSDSLDLNQVFIDEMKYFISCLNKQIPTFNDAREGIMDLKIALGLKEKADKHRKGQ